MSTGPSHFAEVSGVTFTPAGGSAINIFSVSNIRLSRSKSIVKGMDNNKVRPVSAHTVAINDSVSFESDDINALKLFEAVVVPGVLVFTWIAATNQLTSSPLANQTVTISGLMVESIDTDAASKGLGKGQFRGFLLEQTSAAEPVVYS